jgi:NAD/NADP transhydrogenase alpha subunit
MKIDQILVLKETREGERHVALTPKTVSLLAAKNYRVMIESEAGNHNICDRTIISRGFNGF